MFKDYSEIKEDIKEYGTQKLRYDYSANLRISKVFMYGEDVINCHIVMTMGESNTSNIRTVEKEYTVNLDGEKRSLKIEIEKDRSIDNYFSLHQLKEMNFDIANIVASKLGATTQPVRCGKDDD